MGPLPSPYGHDFPRLVDELVPGFTGEIDDIVVRLEDPVGQPVVAHELPDVLGRVQFGRSCRQGQECQIGRDLQLVGGVPTGLIEEDDALGAVGDLGGDFLEMPLHSLAVAARQHESSPCAALWTDGSEDIGRLGSLVVGRPGPSSARRPAAGDLVFLPYAGLILKPQLYGTARREPGTDLCQLGRETFLKASTASSFCA